MWKIQVYEDAAKQYRWRIKAANGRIVGDSGEGYTNRSNARRAAEDARSRIGSASIEDA